MASATILPFRPRNAPELPPPEALVIQVAFAGRRVSSEDGTRSTVLNEDVSLQILDVDRGQGTQFMAVSVRNPNRYGTGRTIEEAKEVCLRKLLGL